MENAKAQMAAMSALFPVRPDPVPLMDVVLTPTPARIEVVCSAPAMDISEIAEKVKPPWRVLRDRTGGVVSDSTTMVLKCPAGHYHKYFIRDIAEIPQPQCVTCSEGNSRVQNIRAIAENVVGAPFQLIDRRFQCTSKKLILEFGQGRSRIVEAGGFRVITIGKSVRSPTAGRVISELLSPTPAPSVMSAPSGPSQAVRQRADMVMPRELVLGEALSRLQADKFDMNPIMARIEIRTADVDARELMLEHC